MIFATNLQAKSTNIKVKKEVESIPSIPEIFEENNIAPIVNKYSCIFIIIGSNFF